MLTDNRALPTQLSLRRCQRCSTLLDNAPCQHVSVPLACLQRLHKQDPAMVSTDATGYAAERAAAIAAVTLGSALARRVQHAMTGADALSKADASPVTVADFAVQALVVSRLAAAFPGDAFVAEESSAALRSDSELLRRVVDVVRGAGADMGPAEVLAAIDLCGGEGGPGRTWVLDPIDGTIGFVNMRQYCIALGLLEGGVVRVGVLGCPNLPQDAMLTTPGPLGCVFHAVRGDHTWVLMEDEVDTAVPARIPKGKLCKVSDVADPMWSVFCESVETGHSSHELSARVASILGVKSPPVRMDSQAKYGCMARGEASIFLRFPRAGYVENVWDSAPASIIVEEAGGRVSDGRGRPLNFALGRKLDNDDGIVATNALVHDEVISAIQQALREQELAVAN